MVRDLSESLSVPGWPVTGGNAMLHALGVPTSDVALMEDEDRVFIVLRTNDPARPLRVKSWFAALAPALDVLAEEAAAFYTAMQKAALT